MIDNLIDCIWFFMDRWRDVQEKRGNGELQPRNDSVIVKLRRAPVERPSQKLTRRGAPRGASQSGGSAA